MIKLHMLYSSAQAVRERSVSERGGWRQMYVRTGRIVAKSARTYKEGEGRGQFLPFFAYVLNGRPLKGLNGLALR
jgi:hypothetical protein